MKELLQSVITRTSCTQAPKMSIHSPVARHTSGAKVLPQLCFSNAEHLNVNPYVFWLWLEGADFVPNTEDLLPDDLDPRNPSSYYLINLLQKECRGEEKDWDAIAEEVMQDKQNYLLLKIGYLRGILPAGTRIADLGQYED